MTERCEDTSVKLKRIDTITPRIPPFGLFTHEKEIFALPLSFFTLKRMSFEFTRAFRILEELQKPEPDLSFLRAEEPIEGTRRHKFRTIMKESARINGIRSGLK